MKERESQAGLQGLYVLSCGLRNLAVSKVYRGAWRLPVASGG